jgi:U3 small nucleolar ribonucleoprotein component
MPKNLSRLSFTQKQKIARKNRQKLAKLTQQIRKIQLSKVKGKKGVRNLTIAQAQRQNKLIAEYIKFKQTARYV